MLRGEELAQDGEVVGPKQGAETRGWKSSFTFSGKRVEYPSKVTVAVVVYSATPVWVPSTDATVRRKLSGPSPM